MSNPLVYDPLKLGKVFWPQARPYDKQREVVYSVDYNRETYVVAGNKLGKDWIAAYIVILFFLRALKCGKTCRIVTTSVAEHHLHVLWGEIGRFISSSAVPLLRKHGGPLVMLDMELRRADEHDARNPLSYAVGRVSAKGEGLAGHHAQTTLFVADEASGLDDIAYVMGQGWANRMLMFGNPNPCANWWRKGIESGNLVDASR